MQTSIPDIILSTFTDQPGPNHRAALASISLDAWRKSYFWLDASGLALYFLDRLETLRMEDALPPAVQQRLRQNFADNRERTREAVAELIRIDRAFTEASVQFLHVKGLSLVPHACGDPALRLQLDLDLVTSMAHADKCRNILVSMGYSLTGVSPDSWEFAAAAHAIPSLRDLYKAKPQRSVDLHFTHTFEAEARLLCPEWQTWNQHRFPTLTDVERFAGQAAHLLKHVQSEWIRPSWLLEFRNSIHYWRNDESFWQRLRAKADADPSLAKALGVAAVLTSIAFADFSPRPHLSWAVESLDRRMRLWLQRYGREVILADFPGTKLYLLQSASTLDRATRRRLIPLRIPQPVVRAPVDGSLSLRLRTFYASLRYTLFRLRFHLSAGYRYLREAPRWRRCLTETQLP